MSLNRNNGHTTSALVSSSSPNENKTQSIRRVRKAGSALILVRGLPHMTSSQKGEGDEELKQICGQKVYILRKERGKGQKIQKYSGRHIWKPPEITSDRNGAVCNLVSQMGN